MVRILWLALTRWQWSSFRDGGTLVDTGTVFAARDKVQHVVGCAALWLLLALFPFSFLSRLAAALAVALAVELLEGYRFARWEQAGPAGPWPFMADVADGADLAADLLGFVYGALYLLLLRGAG